MKIGLSPVPSLKIKLRLLAVSDRYSEVPVSVLLQTWIEAVGCMADQRCLRTTVIGQSVAILTGFYLGIG